MNIYAYNIPRYTHEKLGDLFPSVRFIQDTGKLLETIQANDLFICMWDDKETLKRIEKLPNKLFPRKEVVDFSANREEMCRFVDNHSKFPVERQYAKYEGTFQTTVPRLENSLNVVVKAGEEHRGQDKYLMYPGQTLTVRDSVVFEEFLDNAESFRVLLIGTDVFIIEYSDDPEKPKSLEQRWIKNINPLLKENEDHDSFKEAIADTKHMAHILGYDYRLSERENQLL